MAVRRAWAARHTGILITVVFTLVGCGTNSTSTPSPYPTRLVRTLIPTLPLPAPQEQPPIATAPASPPDSPVAPNSNENPESNDSGWLSDDNGIALRHLRVQVAEDRPVAPVTIVRVDPAAVQLRVAYDPEQPRVLRTWFIGEQPLLAINGGFFDEHYRSTALVISDGVASETSYEGFGGMLAVSATGEVTLRALRDQPYAPNEAFVQGIQSFPTLVFAGGIPADLEEDGRRARRSAVALDRSGNLLLIVSPTAAFTLRELALWLGESDLDIDRALNLDGGPSTGLFLNSGELREQIDSLGPLPLVLLIEKRQ